MRIELQFSAVHGMERYNFLPEWRKFSGDFSYFSGSFFRSLNLVTFHWVYLYYQKKSLFQLVKFLIIPTQKLAIRSLMGSYGQFLQLRDS